MKAIGLSAKVANMFGVNPMFLVNASRVGLESAGTCSGFGTAVLGIVVTSSFWLHQSGHDKNGPHRQPAGSVRRKVVVHLGAPAWEGVTCEGFALTDDTCALMMGRPGQRAGAHQGASAINLLFYRRNAASHVVE
jgi:hypothetical protein